MSINMPIPTMVGQQYTASNDVTYVWDGQKWISIGSTDNNSIGANPGPNPPGSPNDGDFWFNTDNGILYVYMDSESVWVDARPGSDGLVGLDGPLFR